LTGITRRRVVVSTISGLGVSVAGFTAHLFRRAHGWRPDFPVGIARFAQGYNFGAAQCTPVHPSAALGAHCSAAPKCLLLGWKPVIFALDLRNLAGTDADLPIYRARNRTGAPLLPVRSVISCAFRFQVLNPAIC